MKAIATASFMMCIASVGHAQDKTAIQSIEDRLSRAMVADDGKAAGAVYAEDAILVPPGEPMVSGRSNIEAYWAAHAEGLAVMKLTAMDVQPLGSDFAREIGAYAGTTKGDNPVSFGGKYVIIFKRSGDTWLATTDIWTADKPE